MSQQFDLEPHEWKRERGPKKDPPKYPRKTRFGLTDYGPLPVTWRLILTLFIAKFIVIAMLNW